MSSTTTAKETNTKLECIIPILNVKNFLASILGHTGAIEFWVCMRVEDLDGHVLRIGSGPKEDEPHNR